MSHRNEEIARSAGDAASLIIVMRRQGIAAALAFVVTWNRRRVLNCCLQLAGQLADPHTNGVRERAAEDARWSDADLSRARTLYRKGIRTPHTMEANRVYERRQRAKRRKAVTRDYADLRAIADEAWEARKGIDDAQR